MKRFSRSRKRIVEKDGKYYLKGPEDKLVGPFYYVSPVNFVYIGNNFLAFAKVDSNNGGIIDTKGRWYLPPVFRLVGFNKSPILSGTITLVEDLAHKLTLDVSYRNLGEFKKTLYEHKTEIVKWLIELA